MHHTRLCLFMMNWQLLLLQLASGPWRVALKARGNNVGPYGPSLFA